MRHGIRAEAIARLPGGSVPVYGIGSDLILKLYPPGEETFAATEAAFLGALEGALPVRTPELHGSGTEEGWSYVLMGRLRGRLLSDAWPDVPPHERERLAEQLGVAMAALQAVDVHRVGTAAGDFAAFLHKQREACVERQRRAGLDERWLAQIPAFIERAAVNGHAPPVLLHTELMREHLFVDRGPRGFKLSGLFDFEPAMVGAAEYELASLGLFVTCGDAPLLRRTLRAYGLEDATLGPELQRRCLAWALLHRYSDLPWYLRRLPPAAGVTTLEQLAAHWWAL